MYLFGAVMQLTWTKGVINMKKSELLLKLQEVADDAEINEIIQGVEGLTKTFDLKSIGLDDFKNVLESNEIAKTYYQSSLDSGVGKGVAKYKENFNANELPKIVEEAIKAKSNEGKSELEIKYEEQQKQIEQMISEKAQSEMKTKYTKVLSDKGINKPELVDLIKLSDNEETNNSMIEKFIEIINSSVQEGVKNKFGDNMLAWRNQTFFLRHSVLQSQN